MGNGGLRVCLQNLYADAQRLRGNVSRARKMARAVGIAGAHESIRDRVTGRSTGSKHHRAYTARRTGLVNCGTVGTGHFNRENPAVDTLYQLIGAG